MHSRASLIDNNHSLTSEWRFFLIYVVSLQWIIAVVVFRSVYRGYGSQSFLHNFFNKYHFENIRRIGREVKTTTYSSLARIINALHFSHVSFIHIHRLRSYTRKHRHITGYLSHVSFSFTEREVVDNTSNAVFLYVDSHIRRIFIGDTSALLVLGWMTMIENLFRQHNSQADEFDPNLFDRDIKIRYSLFDTISIPDIVKDFIHFDRIKTKVVRLTVITENGSAIICPTLF